MNAANTRADAPRHRTLAELEAGLSTLPPAPADIGRVALIVCRTAPGVHSAIQHTALSVEQGVPGDEWNRRPPCRLESQVSVIGRAASELIAAGQPLTLSGDNLVVDLDLSTVNLPAGSRLKVGGAEMVVTPMPHLGCQKFQARFGADALKFVNAPANRSKNLRGVYWRVLVAGEVRVGDEIRVLSRQGAA